MTDTNDHGKAAAASARAWEEMMNQPLPPQNLRQAELLSATDWTPHRVFQSRANVGVYAPMARNPWRIRYAIGIAALVVMYGVFQWVTM